MKKITAILLLTVALTTLVSLSYADRGVGRKKARITLNIKSPSAFSSSLNFNLKNGMKYTGSFSNNFTRSAIANTLITYQKGNSVYILPYKQKILVADVRQGYAGTKLIIKVR